VKKSHADIPLNVFLNDKLVGYLKKETSGAINFQYADSWLAWNNALPISLSLPLRERKYEGKVVSAVFDNLLPDNQTIRRRIAQRVKANGDDAFSLLSAIGRDCVGALQFLPEDSEFSFEKKINARPLSMKQIGAILKNLKDSPLGNTTLEEEFRLSLTGAQEKTALLRIKDKWYLPQGNTPTTHIFKPQIGNAIAHLDLTHSVENEHFCMRFTTALNLPTAKTEILMCDKEKVLVVERFDRKWTSDNYLLRLPQEDCCQALSISWINKYEADGGPGIKDILALLKSSDNSQQDLMNFIKTQIVFWLLGTTDGHAKNFSIFLGVGGRFHLTPLYDVMSIQPNVDKNRIPKNKMKLAMAVGKKRHYVVGSITARHFLQQAEISDIPEVVVQNIITDILENTSKAINQVLAELPSDFPEAIIHSIIKGINSRLELFEASLN
jgi:serine/threonine-protein kinase HipA